MKKGQPDVIKELIENQKAEAAKIMKQYEDEEFHKRRIREIMEAQKKQGMKPDVNKAEQEYKTEEKEKVNNSNNTLAEKAKKDHPEYKGNIQSVQDKEMDIFDNNRLKPVEKDLTEKIENARIKNMKQVEVEINLTEKVNNDRIKNSKNKIFSINLKNI